MRPCPTGTLRLAAATVLALGLVPQLAAAAGETVLADVREVYVRAPGSAHLHVQQGIRGQSSRPAWLEVMPRAEGAPAVLAMLPPGVDAAAGDVVALRLAPPAPRAIPSGLLLSSFDGVGGHAGAPTGTVLRVVERRNTVHRAPEPKIVAEGGRLFVRAVSPADPAARPTALAGATAPQRP